MMIIVKLFQQSYSYLFIGYKKLLIINFKPKQIIMNSSSSHKFLSIVGILLSSVIVIKQTLSYLDSS